MYVLVEVSANVGTAVWLVFRSVTYCTAVAFLTLSRVIVFDVVLDIVTVCHNLSNESYLIMIMKAK